MIKNIETPIIILKAVAYNDEIQKDILENMIIKMQDDLIDKMFLGKALDYDDKNKK